MSGTFLVIFTVFWSGFVLIFDVVIVRNLVKQAESANYQFVTGTVTRSEVRVHHSSKGGTSYSPFIQYRYEMAGQSFTGERLRYGSGLSSSQATARSMVGEHPAGSTIQVFYDPENPGNSLLFTGIEGSDFMMILFLTPFNSVMVGLLIWIYNWLRERIFHPAAGGMKIITDGTHTRVRLPQYGAAIWWLGATGGLGFAAIFVVGFSTRMRPSIAVILTTIAAVYLAGGGAFFWQWLKIRSGIDDLIINEAGRSLDLPETFGRTERVTVNIADIESLTVEPIEHRGNKGGVSYTYAPTLRWRGTEPAESKLADWSDKLKADDFAEWLRNKLGL